MDMANATAPANGDVDQDHLDRSQKVWDRWSDKYGMSEKDFGPLLDGAVDRLELAPGDEVLEVGCGPGTNFERLREKVGEDGRIVAVDYSPKMVERARERAAENGWENVEVIRADATRVELEPGRFDAALASLSMSVMPDAEAATQRVHEALAPGARFAVLDLRCVPSGPLRVVNPFLSLFYRWFANWNPDEDVVEAVRETFGDVAVEETYAAGACYRALATKDERTGSRTAGERGRRKS